MITQGQYEAFRDNINTLIQEYREKFSVPVITDSRKYEETYRKRLLGMSVELRSMIDHASSIAINEYSLSTVLYEMILSIPNSGSSYAILRLLSFIISFTRMMNAFSLASSNDDRPNSSTTMEEA